MPEIETFPLWGEPDPNRYGICDRCGQLTEHPDVTACDTCSDLSGDPWEPGSVR